jgi:excisionase family DNA binding protein
MNSTPTKRYLTNDEAAQYLALGRQTLPKLRLRATGPMFHKFGRTVRYAIEDLDAWAKDHSRRSTSERPEKRHRTVTAASAPAE